MINYYEPENFTRTVFTVEYGEVVEHILADLCREYADKTTSPRGVEPCFHVRDSELWAWENGGNHPTLVMEFDNKEEAEHALLLSFRYDLYSGDNNPCVFDTREEAEEKMRELQEELDD